MRGAEFSENVNAKIRQFSFAVPQFCRLLAGASSRAHIITTPASSFLLSSSPSCLFEYSIKHHSDTLHVYNIRMSVTQGDARALQERLHELLTRLSDATITMKNWEESSADSPDVHIEATTSLITNIQEILKAIDRVETTVKNDEELFQTLQDCPIPLDLLDLMDCQGGLNPECFTRGLLKEALGQLAGLKRRKLALDMLGDAIERGLNKSKLDGDNQSGTAPTREETGVKRTREGEDKEEESSEPSVKRAKAS